jgi:hypothetical protein
VSLPKPKKRVMNCWICGLSADTGEHRIKASDLRLLFGHVSQKEPVFLHDAVQKNQVVRGIRSNDLKSPALICGDCNNRRTQAFDRAWERASRYFADTPPPRSGSKVNFHRIFPGTVKQGMLMVHLFFVKLFGCVVVEHGVPLPSAGFAHSIVESVAHPHVYLGFNASPDPSKKVAGYSNLETVNLNGQTVFAAWLYFLDKFVVRIMYAMPSEMHRHGLKNAWHPYDIRTVVRVGEPL